MVDNRGPQLQAVCSTFVCMAFVSTLLRCWVRIRMVKSFGWDDATMVMATLTHIMFATCAIAGIHYGTGRHMWDLEPHNIVKAMRYWWLCYVAYCLTMIAAKISIGIFLLRLTVSKIHHWIIYTVMFLTVVTGVVFFFVTLFQCNPIDHFWEQAVGQPGSCINIEIIQALTYLYGTISAICDFTFGILPIFLVWNLNMDRKTKIALIPILSMACVASSAVLVRMAYIKDFKTNDFLYKTVDIAIWSDTEQGLAITAGSLATLRPLFKLLSSRLGLSNGGSAHLKSPGPAGRPSFSNPLDRSGGGRSSRARRGPFSFGTTLAATQNDTTTMDEEFRMNNMKPMKLPEDSSTYFGEDPEPDKTGSYWRAQEKVRESDGDSQEELNRRPNDEEMYLPGRFMNKR